jgi:hypothetical protein
MINYPTFRHASGKLTKYGKFYTRFVLVIGLIGGAIIGITLAALLITWTTHDFLDMFLNAMSQLLQDPWAY